MTSNRTYDSSAACSSRRCCAACRSLGKSSLTYVTTVGTKPRCTQGKERRLHLPCPLGLHTQVRKVCEDFGAQLREFNCASDHVHLLVHYPPSIALSRLVGSLKGVSARRLRRDFPDRINKYLWGEHLWPPPTLPAHAVVHRWPWSRNTSRTRSAPTERGSVAGALPSDAAALRAARLRKQFLHP